MDKATALTVLLLIATPLVVITLGIGWLMDDEQDNGDNQGTDKGQCNNDSDIRVYVPMRRRNRRGNNGRDQQEGKR